MLDCDFSCVMNKSCLSSTSFVEWVNIQCKGGNLLPGGLQLADLKPDEQVVLADTMTQAGLGDGVKLRCWN